MSPLIEEVQRLDPDISIVAMKRSAFTDAGGLVYIKQLAVDDHQSVLHLVDQKYSNTSSDIFETDFSIIFYWLPACEGLHLYVQNLKCSDVNLQVLRPRCCGRLNVFLGSRAQHLVRPEDPARLLPRLGSYRHSR